jgi:hypothetical protein
MDIINDNIIIKNINIPKIKNISDKIAIRVINEQNNDYIFNKRYNKEQNSSNNKEQNSFNNKEQNSLHNKEQNSSHNKEQNSSHNKNNLNFKDYNNNFIYKNIKNNEIIELDNNSSNSDYKNSDLMENYKNVFNKNLITKYNNMFNILLKYNNEKFENIKSDKIGAAGIIIKSEDEQYLNKEVESINTGIPLNFNEKKITNNNNSDIIDIPGILNDYILLFNIDIKDVKKYGPGVLSNIKKCFANIIQIGDKLNKSIKTKNNIINNEIKNKNVKFVNIIKKHVVQDIQFNKDIDTFVDTLTKIKYSDLKCVYSELKLNNNICDSVLKNNLIKLLSDNDNSYILNYVYNQYLLKIPKIIKWKLNLIIDILKDCNNKKEIIILNELKDKLYTFLYSFNNKIKEDPNNLNDKIKKNSNNNSNNNSNDNLNDNSNDNDNLNNDDNDNLNDDELKIIYLKNKYEKNTKIYKYTIYILCGICLYLFYRLKSNNNLPNITFNR